MKKWPAHTLAVVALMAIWWVSEGTSFAVTALLLLVLFPLLGIMTSKEVAPNYANHLIFLFLGGFMIATAFLSMWISNTTSTIMMLTVAMAVVRQIALDVSLNGERNSESQKKIENGLGLVLMLGLAYSASIGGVGTPIGTPSNIVFAGFYKKLSPDNPEIIFFSG